MIPSEYNSPHGITRETLITKEKQSPFSPTIKTGEGEFHSSILLFELNDL